MKNLKTYIQNLTTLSEKDWIILSDCLREQKFKKGEPLLKENEQCNSIFFIDHGFCKSSYNKDGKEINTAFYFENDFVTNVKSLTGGTKSEYEITAGEDMITLKFDRSRLLEAYKKSQAIETVGRKLLEIIVSRQEDQLNSFKLMTPQQRYEKLILTHPDFLKRVSLTQIASYLGISRETLSRIRAR
ncbi:MAG TPA: Crp/Fnr family transcriptional regulator [Bacteroidia bacterium]|jgi:CRP-like cAMP-binding protein|nr:Crp/Fnr family transcriptional regulator [Bacteroidia bacterium]